jgi:hypothetical protein
LARVQTKHSPRPLWGRGAKGEGDVRSQKAETRNQSGCSYSALMTSDFRYLISEDPLTLYPSPPEGEREVKDVEGTPPPHFRKTNAPGPVEPQGVDPAERRPLRFSKVRMHILRIVHCEQGVAGFETAEEAKARLTLRSSASPRETVGRPHPPISARVASTLEMWWSS